MRLMHNSISSKLAGFLLALAAWMSVQPAWAVGDPLKSDSDTSRLVTLSTLVAAGNLIAGARHLLVAGADGAGDPDDGSNTVLAVDEADAINLFDGVVGNRTQTTQTTHTPVEATDRDALRLLLRQILHDRDSSDAQARLALWEHFIGLTRLHRLEDIAPQDLRRLGRRLSRDIHNTQASMIESLRQGVIEFLKATRSMEAAKAALYEAIRILENARARPTQHRAAIQLAWLMNILMELMEEDRLPQGIFHHGFDALATYIAAGQPAEGFFEHYCPALLYAREHRLVSDQALRLDATEWTHRALKVCTAAKKSGLAFNDFEQILCVLEFILCNGSPQDIPQVIRSIEEYMRYAKTQTRFRRAAYRTLATIVWSPAYPIEAREAAWGAILNYAQHLHQTGLSELGPEAFRDELSRTIEDVLGSLSNLTLWSHEGVNPNQRIALATLVHHPHLGYRAMQTASEANLNSEAAAYEAAQTLFEMDAQGQLTDEQAYCVFSALFMDKQAPWTERLRALRVLLKRSRDLRTRQIREGFLKTEIEQTIKDWIWGVTSQTPQLCDFANIDPRLASVLETISTEYPVYALDARIELYALHGVHTANDRRARAAADLIGFCQGQAFEPEEVILVARRIVLLPIADELIAAAFDLIEAINGLYTNERLHRYIDSEFAFILKQNKLSKAQQIYFLKTVFACKVARRNYEQAKLSWDSIKIAIAQGMEITEDFMDVLFDYAQMLGPNETREKLRILLCVLHKTQNQENGLLALRRISELCSIRANQLVVEGLVSAYQERLASNSTDSLVEAIVGLIQEIAANSAPGDGVRQFAQAVLMDLRV
ncbi:MAG TPA: hypothetical protein PLV25_00105 [Opitutales bacterium]|nr:hypothetical protein [Opitutales bacterium]